LASGLSTNVVHTKATAAQRPILIGRPVFIHRAMNPAMGPRRATANTANIAGTTVTSNWSGYQTIAAQPDYSSNAAFDQATGTYVQPEISQHDYNGDIQTWVGLAGPTTIWQAGTQAFEEKSVLPASGTLHTTSLMNPAGNFILQKYMIVYNGTTISEPTLYDATFNGFHVNGVDY